MNILEKIKNSITYFDGAMGSVLMEQGLKSGEAGELLNITQPEKIIAVHKSYLDAGCDIITTNTFGANSLKFENYGEIITYALDNAKKAISGYENKFIAFDVGPLGKLLKPYGDLDFEDAVNIFKQSIAYADDGGADVILIETMNDSLETKAAVIAAKEVSKLPVFVTNVYDASGKLMTGADAKAMCALLEGLKVDALGMNCSLGPKQMLENLKELVKYSSTPIIVNPNAGLPVIENGKTVYNVSAEGFADEMAKMADMGATILGGCCGTTPLYIKHTVEKTKNKALNLPCNKNITLVSSYTHAVEIGKKPVLIGERINPTGKAKFKQALRDNNIDYILSEGIKQQENGAHILDVNVGLPEIDEVKMLSDVVYNLQAVCNLPLQIDTADVCAMEKAMRIYNGKPLVNSVNGKEDNMAKIFPLVQKYGGTVIALAIDEDGIPQTAYGRYKVIEKIVNTASEYGIKPKDIIADPLAMTISSDNNSAQVTLEAIRLIKDNLGISTSLGVSNISFGLPRREIINSVFFAQALQNGLDCAIINVQSESMMNTYYSYCALGNMDANCESYIEYVSKNQQDSPVSIKAEEKITLEYAIKKGLKEKAYTLAEEMLKTTDKMTVINQSIIPALNEVGADFESKKVFLPQLLTSAETAQSAFEAIKNSITAENTENGNSIILATVKGDIHDIGKNIVKVLLNNYGFNVIDLGKDVAKEDILEYALKNNIELVGLSALMTTTVKSMEQTVELLKQKLPNIKIMVGGAVLTEEYSNMIGADYYAKDAMNAVRYAQKVFEEANK